MEFRELLLGLVLVWLAAKAAGEGMERIGQTAVLGELLAGVIIGPGVLGLVHESEVLHALAELGVLILLFEVGLESDLGDLIFAGTGLTVGVIARDLYSSLVVAVMLTTFAAPPWLKALYRERTSGRGSSGDTRYQNTSDASHEPP